MGKVKKIKVTEDMLVDKLPALVIKQNAPKELSGNFDDYHSFLKARVDFIKDLDLTEAGVQHVKNLKKAVVSWRTGFKKYVDEVNTTYFKNPRSLFKAKTDEVFEEIAEAEAIVDEILQKEEDKRYAKVDAILDTMEKDLQEEYGIDDFEVVRPKKWYNKTANMAEIGLEMKEMFEEEATQRRVYEGNKKLIISACEGSSLNPEVFIDKLDYRILHEVLEEIEEEKRRLLNASSPVEEKWHEVDDSTEEKETTAITRKVIVIEYPSAIRKQVLKQLEQLRSIGVDIKVKE